MDASSISGVSASLAGAQTGTDVGILVLKKVLDMQTQSAMQLIASLPELPQHNNPPNLGNGVDTFA